MEKRRVGCRPFSGGPPVVTVPSGPDAATAGELLARYPAPSTAGVWQHWPRALQASLDVGAFWTERQRIEYALTLLAIMKPESGGRLDIVGDNGHSIGLFQMHDAGAGAGLSVEQRQDPDVQFGHAKRAFTPWFETYTAAGLHPVERATATGHNGQRPYGYQHGYDTDKRTSDGINLSKHYGEAYAALLAQAGW